MLIPYAPSPREDWDLLQWWLKLGELEELEGTFTKTMMMLSAWFNNFQPPATKLFLEKDESGITVAFWLEPTGYGSAFCGFWVSPEKRHTKAALRALLEGLDLAFQTYPVIIAVSKNPVVVSQLGRLGFETGMQVPKAFDGDDAFVLVATREEYNRMHRPNGRAGRGEAHG